MSWFSVLLVAVVLSLVAVLVPSAARAQALPSSVTPAMATVVRSYVHALNHNESPGQRDTAAPAAPSTAPTTTDARTAPPPHPGAAGLFRAIQNEARREQAEAESAVGRAIEMSQLQAADNGISGVGNTAKKKVLGIVRKVVGPRGGFYFGKNLAKGDISACKLVGVEYHFD